MNNLTGQTIRGYEIHECIGEGGYGEVYRAREISVGRDVAVKSILPEHTNKPEFNQRFEAEAQLVAQLEHPFIVPLYAYWQDDAGTFLVMRYVKGGSLRDVLKTQGALSLAQTARMLNQITDALSIAHEANVVHRDLKPGNILLDERGNAYLTDFGIARQIGGDSTITPTNVVVGTWSYLSPEQIQSIPVTPQSDIYSLGVMLYELLVGEHPFVDVPMTMMVMKHLTEELPSIRTKRPDLPEAIDDIIQTATAKFANDRYADVLTIAADFLNVSPLTGSDISNVSAGTPYNLEKSTELATPYVDVSRRPGTSATQLRSRLTPSISIMPERRTPEQRNRYAMIQNVRHFWIESVLENSLHGAALIELGMKREMGSVDHPWDTLLQMPDSPNETLSPGVRILNIFDKLNGKLLILGDPGGGKTTTLLELARDLLSRAEADEAHPLPVVVNLSSWSEERKPLVEWLVDELSGKYQVPRKVATEWVEHDSLLLLLDGLDEVPGEHRDDCVQFINAYREEHGFVDVVVCSRIMDYEALTYQLKLNGAIVIKALDDKQVDSYLKSLGQDMATLRYMLDRDENMVELSRSPLMLSVMALAYRGVSTQEIPDFDTSEAQRKHLFSVYVKRMFERTMVEKTYNIDQTIHYLSWLADRMTEHAQSVFQIENLQPTWLPDDRRQRLYTNIRLLLSPPYAVSWGAPSLLVEPTLGIPTGLLALSQGVYGIFNTWLFTSDRLHKRLYQLFLGLAYGLAVGIPMVFATGRGVVATLLFVAVVTVIWSLLAGSAPAKLLSERGSSRDNIAVVERVRFSRKNINPRMGIAAGLASAVLIVAVRFLFGPETVTPFHFVLGLIGGGGIEGLFAVFQSGLSSGEIEMRTSPNQGIRASLANANRVLVVIVLQMFLFGLLGIGPVTSLEFGVAWGLALGVIYGCAEWFVYGGYTAVQHFVLRYMLRRDGAIPQNYARFLDYATALVLMRKVGGGYIFIHRYLLEYFAELGNDL